MKQGARNKRARKNPPKKNTRSKELAAQAPNGPDLMRILGRDPLFLILQNLSDFDVVTFAETHPDHRPVAERVARHRLLGRMSEESLEQYCKMTGLSYIGTLRRTRAHFHNVIFKNIMEHPVSKKLTNTGVVTNKFISILLDALQGNVKEVEIDSEWYKILIPMALAYGYSKGINELAEEGDLIADGFKLACMLGHDKIAADLLNDYPAQITQKLAFWDEIEPFKLNHLSCVAITVLGRFHTSYSDLLHLYKEVGEETLLNVSDQLFNYLCHYSVLLKDKLPLDVFPGERLIRFAIMLGRTDLAAQLALSVEPQFQDNIKVIYNIALKHACWQGHLELAQRLLAQVISHFNEVPLLKRDMFGAFINSVNNLDRPQSYDIVLKLAEKTDNLPACLEQAMNHQDCVLLSKLLQKYRKNIPAHMIEQSIYNAIANPILAITLNTLLRHLRAHISLVAFDQFIELAAENPHAKQILEQYKLAKKHAHAIPLVYVPGLESKRKKLRTAEVDELNIEASNFLKRKRG